MRVIIYMYLKINDLITKVNEQLFILNFQTVNQMKKNLHKYKEEDNRNRFNQLHLMRVIRIQQLKRIKDQPVFKDLNQMLKIQELSLINQQVYIRSIFIIKDYVEKSKRIDEEQR